MCWGCANIMLRMKNYLFYKTKPYLPKPDQTKLKKIEFPPSSAKDIVTPKNRAQQNSAMPKSYFRVCVKKPQLMWWCANPTFSYVVLR